MRSWHACSGCLAFGRLVIALMAFAGHMTEMALLFFIQTVVFVIARLFELLRKDIYLDVLGLYVYLVPWIYLLDGIRNGQPVLK